MTYNIKLEGSNPSIRTERKKNSQYFLGMSTISGYGRGRLKPHTHVRLVSDKHSSLFASLLVAKKKVFVTLKSLIGICKLQICNVFIVQT